MRMLKARSARHGLYLLLMLLPIAGPSAFATEEVSNPNHSQGLPVKCIPALVLVYQSNQALLQENLPQSLSLLEQAWRQLQKWPSQSPATVVGLCQRLIMSCLMCGEIEKVQIYTSQIGQALRCSELSPFATIEWTFVYFVIRKIFPKEVPSKCFDLSNGILSLRLLGNEAFRMQYYAIAKFFYLIDSRLNPDDPRPYYNLAVVCWMMYKSLRNQEPQVFEAYQQQVCRNMGLPASKSNRLKVKMLLNQPDSASQLLSQAIVYGQKVLELDPEYGEGKGENFLRILVRAQKSKTDRKKSNKHSTTTGSQTATSEETATQQTNTVSEQSTLAVLTEYFQKPVEWLRLLASSSDSAAGRDWLMLPLNPLADEMHAKWLAAMKAKYPGFAERMEFQAKWRAYQAGPLHNPNPLEPELTIQTTKVEFYTGETGEYNHQAPVY